MLQIVLIVAAAALIVYLLFKVARKALSVAFTVATVIGIVLLILGFFVIQDALSFQEEFRNNKSVFVLSDNGTYAAAVVLDPNSTDTVTKYPNAEELEEALAGENYPDEYSKFFIIKKGTFDSIEGNVSLGFAKVGADVALEALYGEEPLTHVTENMNTQLPPSFLEGQMRKIFETEEDFRTHLFGALLIKVIGDSPINVIEEVQNENIIIKPETLLFQTIRYIPKGVFGAVESLEEEDAGQDEILEK